MRRVLKFVACVTMAFTVLVLAQVAGKTPNQAAADSVTVGNLRVSARGLAYVSGAMDGTAFVSEELADDHVLDSGSCRRNWPLNRIYYDFEDYYQLRAHAEVTKRDKNAEWWRWKGLNEGAFGIFMEYLEDRCVTQAGVTPPPLAELRAITGHHYILGMPLEHSKLYTEGLRDGLSLAALRAGPDSALWPIAECPDKYPDRRPYPILLFWIGDFWDRLLDDNPPASPPVFGRDVAELMYEFLLEKCPK